MEEEKLRMWRKEVRWTTREGRGQRKKASEGVKEENGERQKQKWKDVVHC